MHNTREINISNFGAIEQSDGSYIDTYGDIAWYNKAGQYHREEGPAVIYASGRSYWYLNSKEYDSFDDWLIKANISDKSKMMLRLQYG
jgi:hypothetical protein